MPAPARRAPRLVVLVAGAALLTAPPARAADPVPAPAGTALGHVPADAEYFRSVLRMGETVAAIGRTRVWQQLWAEPSVQELVTKARAAYEGDDAGWKAIRGFLADPANAALPGLVADALSHEAFLYVGPGAGESLALIQELAGGARYGPAFQKLLQQNPGDDADRARTQIVLRMLAEKPDRLRGADLVLGFKVSDPAAVATQLKRLDPLLADALKDSLLADRSKRVAVGGDSFLTLAVDGSLVPWEGLVAKYEDQEGEFAPLVKHLKALKLTVAVGVRKGYLLVGVGGSADHLAKFGGDGPKLAGRPELAPVAKLAGKPLTAVGYVSQVLRAATATTAEDVMAFGDLAKSGLDQLPVPDETRKAIEGDVTALLKSIAAGLVKPGALAEATVRTPRGWETFAHDYTPSAAAPARPLTLLNHLGGDPLLAAVWRSGTTAEDYRAGVKWVTKFAGHAESLVEALAPDKAETVKTVRNAVAPVLLELSDVTETLWIPALADGQEAIVLDAKWTSKQWHQAMPPTDAALPLPEFAVVLGVSDAAKLGKALEGYRAGANKLIAKVRELAPPGSVPEFEIPKPTVEAAGGNTFAYYPIPEALGVDPQFQPTGGLSDRVAVLALSRKHAERLLAATPLKTTLAPLADPKRPLDSAFYLSGSGVAALARPWVEYAVRDGGPAPVDATAREAARKSVGLLGVFRGYASATYRDGGATVTHSEAAFADLPAAKK